MILMLVLMGSVSAMAQGLKIKKFSYAKSGETLKGGQLYARTIDSRALEAEQGYAPYPWILYLENGGTVELQLPDGQKYQVAPGMHSFTYHNGETMYIDVRVVPYAVPYLGQLRLQGAVSHANVRLEKTVSEEDFFTYTINSDLDLKTIKIQSGGGREINGNKGIYATIIKEFPQGNYRYASELPHQELFAQGVSIQYLKEQAHNRGLDPNDFVLQIALDSYGGGSIFSEVYKDQAREELKTTFLRIIDKRQKYYTLKASSNDEALGTVEPATLTVKAGGEATFTAKAKENAIFKGWKQKGSAEVTVTESVLKLTNVQEASEWTAVFEKKAEEKYYTLKASSSDQALGSVNPAELTVKAGDEARFTATAKENAIFKRWERKGAAEERDTPVLHLTNIQEASEWIAVFEPKPEEKHTLTVKVEPEHVGKVLLDGEDLGSVTVKKRTRVRLKAEVVDQNYEFRAWKTAGEVSLGKQNPFDYPVDETETVIAVFVKKASAPQVGPVAINFGQREALLTWAAGSATSWIVKVYQGEQIVFDQEIQTPQLVLVGLKPGENYRYEIVAKMSGKLPSQAVQGSFRTDQFDVNDLLTPYLKNFSKIERNKSFPIILLDVDPRDFPQEMTVEAYSLDEREVKSSLTLRNDGKIYWMILPEGKAKALVFVLKSGSEIRYELTYDLSK